MSKAAKAPASKKEAEAEHDEFDDLPEQPEDYVPDAADEILDDDDDDEEAPAAAPAAKPKKPSTSASASGDGASLLFDATKKKKKRKTKKVGFNPEGASAGGEGEGSADAGGEGNTEGGDASSEPSTSTAALFSATGEYTYDALLKRAFDLIGQSKPDKVRSKIPYPQAFRIGTSRTLWANFPAIVKALNRLPQHLLNFVIVELGTTANLDASGRVVIKGRFLPKQLDSLVRKYLTEYVLCKTCGSRDTTLKKENRLHFLQCNSTVCGSTRSLPPLNKGYVHRIKRKKPT
eukprot:TRINITY_DN526_c0_g1_i1.p1 TRINITY_DN526_c0_g1~~TRINITY_DN526_c0_g1_i1.p1  ORF type:complete len:317 (+),score=79.42 TRINITY_DN526_c0_g1_i1:82-951(+)